MENNINNIIRERRSHYPHEYSGKILDETIIETLLENANWAPNHTLNFPWRFIILKGPKMIEWLDKAYEIYVTQTPADKFNQKKADKIKDQKNQVSHVIVIIHQKDTENANKLMENVAAIACGVQNMYLTLSQFPNAVGYWSTGSGTFNPIMHAYFKLNDDQQLLGYFMLGDIEKKRTESKRRDFREFIIGG